MRGTARLLGWGGLAGVLALGGALRLYHLTGQGLVYWDEGKFALEGVRLESAVSALVGGHANLAAGKAVGTAKPTHALLIALAYMVLGVHDYSPLLLDSACSLAEIVLVYLLAQRLFGQAVAILSALLLAISEYDVIYARSALSESDAACLLLAGVLIWLWPGPVALPSWRHRLLAGALLGAAFTVNYRMSVYILAIIIFDLTRATRMAGVASVARRGPAWTAGLLIAPLLWQAVDLATRAGGLVLFRSEVTGLPVWYLQQALYQLHEGKQAVVHFSPVVYLQWYILRQGWVPFLLLLLGLVRSVLVRRAEILAMSTLVVVPYALFVFAPFYVPRNLTAALPFASVLSASALVWLVSDLPRMIRSSSVRANGTGQDESLRADGVSAAVLLAVALVEGGIGATMSWRLTAERSGFARAASYLHPRGDRALTSTELMAFYLRQQGGACGAPALPQGIDGLSAFVAAGYRYAVLDRHASGLTSLIRARARRVARYPALGYISLGESLISSENSNPPNASEPVEHVDVYDLSGLALPGPGRLDTSLCNPNTPV